MLNEKTKKGIPILTCQPWVKEDIEGAAVVLPGPTDPIPCHHGNIQEVLSHNAVCLGGDSHGDCVV